MDLAFYQMAAGVAGAVFVAVTIALTVLKDLPRGDPGRTEMAVVLTLPMLVIACGIFAFVIPPISGAVMRGVVGVLLLLSMNGLVWVLLIRPSTANRS